MPNASAEGTPITLSRGDFSGEPYHKLQIKFRVYIEQPPIKKN